MAKPAVSPAEEQERRRAEQVGQILAGLPDAERERIKTTMLNLGVQPHDEMAVIFAVLGLTQAEMARAPQSLRSAVDEVSAIMREEMLTDLQGHVRRNLTRLVAAQAEELAKGMAPLRWTSIVTGAITLAAAVFLGIGVWIGHASAIGEYERFAPLVEGEDVVRLLALADVNRETLGREIDLCVAEARIQDGRKWCELRLWLDPSHVLVGGK